LGVIAALAACDEGTEVIGPDGGVVQSLDRRVTLDIPAGALDHDVAITIGEVDDAGPEGAIGRTYEILPRGTQLLYPAMIEYDLAPGKTDGTAGLELTSATVEDVALATERGDRWEELADLEVDLEAHVVSASVMFFSSYAVVLGE
jgi:hypothetical protein